MSVPDPGSESQATGRPPGPRGEDRPESSSSPRVYSGTAHPDATVDYNLKNTTSQPGAVRGESPAESGPYDFLDPPRALGELGWLAHYRVRRLLGEGGMGLVFEAQDTDLLRPVALKVIRPELAGSAQAAQRFTLEARAMAALKHDHIVTIYQVGQERGVPFLAMEYLQGMSLYRWLERGHKPSLDLVLRLGREMAAGLAVAHQRGLIHRDIKPANIWLEAPLGRVKILDFGLARSETNDVQITNPGTTVGTPAYMAPEQASGAEVTAASDLFSLGCVLYQLCTGGLPFPGMTVMAVLTSLSVGTPSPVRDLNPAVPPALDVLVMQLLAKTPADRPVSAEVVVQAIKSIERELQAERQKAELSSTTPLPTVVGPRKPARAGIAGEPGPPRPAAKARRVRRRARNRRGGGPAGDGRDLDETCHALARCQAGRGGSSGAGRRGGDRTESCGSGARPTAEAARSRWARVSRPRPRAETRRWARVSRPRPPANREGRRRFPGGVAGSRSAASGGPGETRAAQPGEVGLEASGLGRCHRP